MDPHLQRLQVELSTAIQGLTTKELNTHHPEKWCVGEILEHLYLTYTGTTNGFSRVLASDTSHPKTPTISQRLRTFLVTGIGYFPSGVKAPQAVTPRGLLPENAISEVTSKIAEMDEIMSRCEVRFGRDAKVLDHPVLGPLSVLQWGKFHLVHGRHHLKQIRQLRSGAQKDGLAGK